MALKRTGAGVVIPEHSWGVCLWEVDGKVLGDVDQNFLSMEGVLNDPKVEAKMREAAYYWLEAEVGHPKWVPGARKVTLSEYEDQMERMLDGKIPDPVDEIRQIMERRK